MHSGAYLGHFLVAQKPHLRLKFISILMNTMIINKNSLYNSCISPATVHIHVHTHSCHTYTHIHPTGCALLYSPTAPCEYGGHCSTIWDSFQEHAQQWILLAAEGTHCTGTVCMQVKNHIVNPQCACARVTVIICVLCILVVTPVQTSINCWAP